MLVERFHRLSRLFVFRARACCVSLAGLLFLAFAGYFSNSGEFLVMFVLIF